MQPGDIYQPPPGSGGRRDDPYAPPPGQYGGNPPYPPPPPPQQYPGPAVSPAPSMPSYQGNPFNDEHAPRPPTATPLYDNGLQRYDSPYNLGDTRLTSPPPLGPPVGGSSHDLSYPPRPIGPPGGGGSYTPMENDDFNDAQPLLSHARPDPGFGVSATHNPMQANRPPPSGGIRFGSDVRFDNQYGDGGLRDDGSNVHYGPLPTRVLRRNRTQKRIQLFQGHLVLDVEVPNMLLNQCPIKDGNEFTKMRYTAVTCDPNDFVVDKYTLRQKLYDPPRHTELFIVVTMYNEDDVLFCRTMRGIMQNVAHLCSRSRSKTWGDEGWKKVVVCIVSDGRLKINARTRSVLAALGVYQDGVGKNFVNGKPVTAHLYEYTTQLSINSKGKIGPGGDKHVPIQLIFCLKEKNQKKINSHRWFFNAFGECLKPNVCVLLDVGTQPGPDSIYHLWKAFDINSSVGGACGEIVALKGMFWKNLLNPLVAAQNFEYKMSNILDKPLESIFGYITVLPGAFSAYRYIAIQNDDRGQGPLEKYFYGETMHGAGAGIFQANMYLAEDRILCWELVSKRDCKWTLHYVKSSYAITDVPDRVPELVSQRRRWLNGSFFAAIHAIVHFGYLYRSSHSIVRKFFLHIELIYQIITNVFAWFALGNFYIAFYVLTQSMDIYGKVWEYVGIGLQYLYLAFLLLCFVLALGNRPQGSVVGYTSSMVGFALITVYMLFCAVFLAVKGITKVMDDGAVTVDDFMHEKMFVNVVVSLLATYGLYIVASLISLDPWHMLTSFVQYLLLAASYINVLNVYAFSNVHDVSWGTKGSDKASEDLGAVKSDGKNEVTVELALEQQDINAVYANELQILATKPPKEIETVNEETKQDDYYKNFRTNVLLCWIFCNGALASAIIQVNNSQVTARNASNPDSNDPTLAVTYMGVMLYTVAGLAAFRFIGASTYLIVRLFMGE